jgi:hypothetical protein
MGATMMGQQDDHPIPPEERLLLKLYEDCGPLDTPCWIYSGGLKENGYGNFQYNGTTCSAHRVAYELWRGQIPISLWVLHKCDRPACCNPDHLFLGTPKDNSADRDLKGRGSVRIGSNNTQARLIESEVVVIKQMLKAGIRNKDIARQFNVSHSLISMIQSGRNWGHV